MKHYILFSFQKHGIFTGREFKENGETLIIGKFKNSTERIFIKHPKDISI